ncbi:MAG: class I tRNA ligase family protein [Acidobacteria bacterium]|nr:class I tRNA ligase family protein [Acidobacteriota bacterium]
MQSSTDLERLTRARTIRNQTIREFHDRLAADGIHRLYLIWENGEFSLSHPQILEPVRAFFELSHDFQDHEGVFIGREDGIESLFFAFVHDTRRGLAQGGLRFRSYETMADVLTDGLRLSQGMTRKNALAGLHWGGGKGIATLPPGYERPDLYDDRAARDLLFGAYGRFVASLGGVYYTAEDIGTNTPDMDAILRENRFTTCVSPSRGGSGNPSPHTALGVFIAMKAAWKFLHGTDDLRRVRVSVQGAGNVGRPLIDLLDEAGAEIWTCDPNPAAIESLQTDRPRVHIVDSSEIFDLDVDVFAPCAIGAQVNVETIPRLRADLICGAANNQLREPADAERLLERGITYVPDYLCNRMGITNCADEWAGHLDQDVALAAHRVFPDTIRVLRHARNLRITTAEAADQLADIAAADLHPVLGHRGRRLIDQIISSKWHRDTDATVIEPVIPIYDPHAEDGAMHRAERAGGAFRGEDPLIAAQPVSTAWRPHLGTFVSALLMDVDARACSMAGSQPARAIGVNHGGLSLQLAVEQNLPGSRHEIDPQDLIDECEDRHEIHSAVIRDQLAASGIGFDPRDWLDPMTARGRQAVADLYTALRESDKISEDSRPSARCPSCETVLVASDTIPSGDDEQESARCRRCRSIVEIDTSPQLFVDFSDEASSLADRIEAGEITYGDRWNEVVTSFLRDIEPWCITRQYLWGNEVPRRAGDVFSSWFSMIAMTLEQAGWPEPPGVIDRVYVDPEFLTRWIVPAQLASLATSDRPLVREVRVHGKLHIVSKKLVEKDDASTSQPDEERFLFRRTTRPMKRSLGNVVEPQSLVERFGADSLRLGLLLSLGAGGSESFTYDESRARTSRAVIRKLISSFTWLTRRNESAGDTADVVREVGVHACESSGSLAAGDFRRSAELLVQAVDAINRYEKDLRVKIAAGEKPGDVTATTKRLAKLLYDGFHPIAPFVTAAIVRRSRAQNER